MRDPRMMANPRPLLITTFRHGTARIKILISILWFEYEPAGDGTQLQNVNHTQY